MLKRLKERAKDWWIHCIAPVGAYVLVFIAGWALMEVVTFIYESLGTLPMFN